MEILVDTIKISMLIMLSFLLVSCGGQPTKNNDVFAVVYDPMLSFIKVGKIKHRKKGEITEFSAEVINISNLAENLKFKFKFYDRDGFQIANFSKPWLPFKMAPYEVTNLQAVAPNKTVVSAKLFIERQK